MPRSTPAAGVVIGVSGPLGLTSKDCTVLAVANTGQYITMICYYPVTDGLLGVSGSHT